MSTLGMRPRRGGHSEDASPTSPRISTYKTWREQLSKDISGETSGRDASREAVFEDTDEEQEERDQPHQPSETFPQSSSTPPSPPGAPDPQSGQSDGNEGQEDEENNERIQNEMQEDIEEARKEAQEDEEIIQQLFQTSQSTQHARESMNIPDTSSESIDESEEEIRQTIENFRRRDAARRSTWYTGIGRFRPAALWKADSKGRERKSKTGKKAKAEGKKQPVPSYLKFWTWNWRGPQPVSFIPVPPPYHPDNPEPEIKISYTCGHRLPTRVISSPTASKSSSVPKTSLPLLPSLQIETLRATAQKEGLHHITTPQNSLCPNCFIWYEWFIGLCLLISFWVLWGYFFSFRWPETWWILGDERGGWRWTPRRCKVVVNIDTSGGGRVSY
ncbi:hypothetical protein EAF04_005419 [Stromatinia cepivora]|nr:hypothetical protein EAF04_005419 [Stromatinia cepivora]